MRRTDTAVTPAKARVHADGGTLLVGAALVTVTVGAWAAVLARAATSSGGMAIDTSTPAGPDLAGATGFVGTWVVMMAAMMLPSAAPLVLLYRGTGADGRAVNAVPLVAAYLRWSTRLSKRLAQ